MSTDKMRDDFEREAWALYAAYCAGEGITREQFTSKNKDGCYISPVIYDAWFWFKKSRESLTVELPYPAIERHGENLINEDLVCEAIESQGIKVITK